MNTTENYKSPQQRQQRAEHAEIRRLERQERFEALGSASERGYGLRHRKWHVLALKRDPLCKIGKLCGGFAPSTEADHIVPIRTRRRSFRSGKWTRPL